jgi:hypothetical protein
MTSDWKRSIGRPRRCDCIYSYLCRYNDLVAGSWAHGDKFGSLLKGKEILDKQNDRQFQQRFYSTRLSSNPLNGVQSEINLRLNVLDHRHGYLT